MINGLSRSDPIDIPEGGRKSFCKKYFDLKKNEMLDLLTDFERLMLLVDVIEELAKRDLELAKKLYSKDFKDLDFPQKKFHKKNLESLLGIKKSN
jgi:hypothetical protein